MPPLEPPDRTASPAADRPAAPPREAAERELERRCGDLGIPLTVQRRAVLAALVGRTDHPTADEVFHAVNAAMPTISRGTTYRTLDTLVALGLVTRVSHPGSVARYDAKTYRHHHLLCDRCGAMVDVEPSQLDEIALPDLGGTGLVVRDYSVQLRGLCSRCADLPQRP